MLSVWFFLLRKRQFSWLLMASLIGLGIYCVALIPKESAPEVIVPIGIVTTVYPGASAADIEELVTNKLEDDLDNLDDLQNLTSTSRDGVSSITVEFNAKADIDKSIQKLKDAVDAAKSDLPDDANDPIVTEVNFADQPIHVISISSDLPAQEFTKLGDELKTEFEKVHGVSKVDVSGTRDREIQVVLREERLNAYDLSTRDVQQALAGANLSVPVGTVLNGGIEYSIRFEGDLLSADDVRNVPIKAVNGLPVYVRDVADVYDGVSKESTLSRVSVDGAPSEKALTLSIYKKSGFDVTAMSAGVHAKLDALQGDGGLLANSQVLIVFDQGDQTRKDLTELIRAGFETVSLVIICLLLTIGWRESVVAALSIPLSFVIAFIGLYLSGNTINFISLFALILAVGILVDSGIVITEAIHTRMRRYRDADEAAEASLREYAWPLIGGTMTTIAVFAPLFFLSGVVGKFIASIPFTLIFVLLASIFVALGMVPLIAITLTKHSHSNRFEAIQEEYTKKAQDWYRSHLVSFLKNRGAQRIFLWALFCGFLLSFVLPVSGMLKVIFFPPENVDYIYVDIETKQGTPIAQTDLVLRQVEEVLYDKPYIASFSSTAGAGNAFTGSGGAGSKYGNVTVALKEDRDITSAEASDDLRESFKPIKDAVITIQELQNGPPSGAPVFIKFLGDDLEELSAVTNRAETLLASIAGTRDITVSTDSNATEFVFSVDRAKANAAGVSALAIGDVLRTAVFGSTATTLSVSGDDIDVVLMLRVSDDAADPSAIPEVSIDTLRNLSVVNARGERVLLGSIMNEELAPANAAIAHEDTKRVESISAYTTEGTTATEVVNAFKAREGELQLPAGITVSYGGETEDINQSFTEMFVALLVGLLLMLAILVLSFNSIRYALYLLLAVPYSLIGVFFGLTITGLSLSFTSLLGVIALSGVIINHAIILMDSMITHKATTGEKPLLETVADAAVSRFRPIILTTITTVIGMIPLSRISDFWGPLAFAIMFGLTFAMILTLLLVPTLFYRNELRKEERVRGITHPSLIARILRRKKQA
jgi:multidrug efflux pump subunit AcrB